jgi:NADP-dependent aldehyde dehydrogenase
MNAQRGNDHEIGTDPRTGQVLPPGLPVTTMSQLETVCAAAAAAAPWLAEQSPAERGVLLRAGADAIDADGDEIVRAADEESAMGAQKLRGELARTTGQLRFLADVVEEGSYLEVTIDHTAGGADLRRCERPIGPVAVFSASNFPLAFSLAGGDTAAALAVGCPVIVKSHPAHPNTSRIVAQTLRRALASLDAPDGVLGVVSGWDAGRSLVMDDRVRAVAFTGSTQGGLALAELVRGRDRPIPVFAEMGSTNPVVVTPAALEAHAEDIIEGFAASFQLGAGQFCTKPGLLFVPAGAVTDVLTRTQQHFHEPAPLLSEGISDAWRERSGRWATLTGGDPLEPDARPGFWATPQLFATTATALATSEVLREECFGPTALVVGYEAQDDLVSALTAVGGSLTGTLWSDGPETDASASAALVVLQQNSGRIVHNSWPTGVAVSWAMQHGGPFPATTSPEHTSVGAASIKRFLRPLAVQNAPHGFLPPPLRDDNPWGLQRRIDGHIERSPLPARGEA